jgi:ribosomal protein L16 Arg81 hydroxylase
MSTVEQIQTAIRELSPKEMEQLREWMENVMEDQLEFTEEFKAKIARSREAMDAGAKPRVR